MLLEPIIEYTLINPIESIAFYHPGNVLEMLEPALPAFLLPAATLLVSPLRLCCFDTRAAGANQLRQAHRLFPGICHPLS